MDAAPQRPIGLIEILSLGLGSALLAGTAFTALDVKRNAPGMPTEDLWIALALAVVPALIAGALAFLLIALGARATRRPLDRTRWSALVAGAFVFALSTAIALLGTKGLGAAASSAWVLGSLPVALVVARLVVRFPRLATRGLPQALCVVGSALLFLLARSNPPSSTNASGVHASELPNVVLVVLDTTRRDYLGSYGQAEDLTPALDAFADQGVVFEDAFATSHWTAPSHASMFTGQHPITHGCSRTDRLWLSERSETAAEFLGGLGFETAAFYSNPWLSRANMLQGFETRAYVFGRYSRLAVHGLAKRIGAPAHWVDLGAGEASSAVRGWLAARRDPSAPFFLFVNLLEAHGPYVVPRLETEGFLPDDIDWDTAAAFARQFPAHRFSAARTDDPHAERIIESLYRAGVRYQDRRFAELIESLASATDLDETLFLVVSDHGENINDDGRWDHEFAVNDPLIHIPLIIRYPKSFPPGTRVAGLCQLDDLLPTIRDVVDPTYAGRSLVPAVFEPRDAVYAQMVPLYGKFDEFIRRGHIQQHGLLENLLATWRVIRTDDWKYIHSSDGQHQLYDLKSDPFERENLGGDGATAAALRSRLHAWLEAQPKYTPDEGEPSAQASGDGGDELDGLRELGYVE